MRTFKFRKPDGTQTPTAFYCRHDNRVVGGCPHDGGAAACPVRRDCQAWCGPQAAAAGDGAARQA